MGRLKPQLLERVESFADRVLDVVEALQRKRVNRRVLDQLTGCGTSVGANVFEADEAMSRPDFCKCLALSVKELSETRYWMRLSGRRGWVKPSQLSALQAESIELSRILGTIIIRSRRQPLPR